MNKKLILIFVFLLTGAVSCKILSPNANKEVYVYKIPFNNSYYIDINIEDVKGHSDRTLLVLKNRGFYSYLNNFFSALDTLKTNDSLKSKDIDIRVLIEYKDKKGQLIQAGMNQIGMLILKGNPKVYNPDENFMKVITQYTKIKWEYL